MISTIQSAVGRLSETRVGKAKKAMLTLVAKLLRRGIISNPPRYQRVIKEKDRD